MKITRFPILALFGVFQLCLASCGEKPNSNSTPASNMNLNSLSKKEYNAFVKEIFKSHQKDAQEAGMQAKQVIIGMTGLENRPESHGIFEVDANFNVNAMLLLVANANKIKREKEFIDEFKREMATTRPQLKTEDQRTFFDGFAALLLSEHAKL